MRERGSRLVSRHRTHKQPDESPPNPPRPTESGAARYEASADGRPTTRIHGLGKLTSRLDVTRIFDLQEAGLQVDAAPPSLRYVSGCRSSQAASAQPPSSNDEDVSTALLEPFACSILFHYILGLSLNVVTSFTNIR